jgi:hypothetical protein
LSFAVAVEYTLVVLLHLLRVGRDAKESVVYLANDGLFVFLVACQLDVYQNALFSTPGFAWF